MLDKTNKHETVYHVYVLNTPGYLKKKKKRKKKEKERRNEAKNLRCNSQLALE